MNEAYEKVIFLSSSSFSGGVNSYQYMVEAHSLDPIFFLSGFSKSTFFIL